MNIYQLLAEGGGFNLPYLVHIESDDKKIELNLMNDNEDLEYKGVVYKASNFTYTPNTEGESTFNIELVESNVLINLLEGYIKFRVDVIGIFNGEEVEETGKFCHRYGSATWTGESLEMRLAKDDRGDMTFPALIFNSYNNRGNN